MANIVMTFQPKANGDAQSELNRNIREMNNSFWRMMTEIYASEGVSKEPQYYAAERLYTNLYNLYNAQFRMLYHNTKNSAVSLYNKQYNKRSMLEQLLSVHPEYQVAQVNRYQKLKYHREILTEVLKEQIHLMYAIYGNNLSNLQIQSSISKVMIDYFTPGDVNWEEAFVIVGKFMQEYDFQCIRIGAQYYGAKPTKIRNAGMTYKTKNTGAEYSIKMLLDQGMKKAQICRELNIPERTLYRIIKKFNLDKPTTLN